MPDIFISYSRKDSAQALGLADRLRASGMDVWIDQHGIEAATAWSKEIVDAIDTANVFILLLSASSIGSVNVVRELAIASESDKPILPIELESVVLPSEFKYQLSGVQRAHYSDFAGILRAVTRLITSQRNPSDSPIPSQHEPSLEPNDTRKSLMVLPFEDLSPGADNAWFADGLMGELISSLSHIKSLRLIDQRTSRDFKDVKVKLTDIAKEYAIRYFIEGSVRKFGDQIKVSLTLLDIITGDHLWQYSHRGDFSDIFDVQEQLAAKTVEGLRLHLTSDEEVKLKERGTDNAEAYELYLKGNEYYDRHTKATFGYALSVFRDAIDLDPKFAEAYVGAADTLSETWRVYDRNPAMLEEAEQLLETARGLKPSLTRILDILAHIRLRQGRFEEAEELAKKFVELEPESRLSHFTLGFLYMEIGQPTRAIPAFEACIRVQPDYLTARWNLVLTFDRAGDTAGRIRAAEEAIPLFEKRLRQFPDDEDTRCQLPNLLFHAGRKVEASVALATVTGLKDAGSFYNLACLASNLGKHELAVRYLRNALEGGFAHKEIFRVDPDLEAIRNRDDFRELMAEFHVH